MDDEPHQQSGLDATGQNPKTDSADDCADNASKKNDSANQPASPCPRQPLLPPVPCPQNQERDKLVSCKENVKYWLEIAGIIFGIFGVAALVLQYREMVKATKATLDAVNISENQTLITKRQLDDSEAQLRAWLRFEPFQIRRIGIRTSPSIPARYRIEINMIIKNYGSTPAIDLAVSSKSLQPGLEQFYTEHGLTNLITKWNGVLPNPSPSNMGLGIMPQESLTNSFVPGEFEVGDDVYFEAWLSYRDIFGHPWIIGEGGTYHFTNDSFSPEFLNSGQTIDQNQTYK